MGPASSTPGLAQGPSPTAALAMMRRATSECVLGANASPVSKRRLAGCPWLCPAISCSCGRGACEAAGGDSACGVKQIVEVGTLCVRTARPSSLCAAFHEGRAVLAAWGCLHATAAMWVRIGAALSSCEQSHEGLMLSSSVDHVQGATLPLSVFRRAYVKSLRHYPATPLLLSVPGHLYNRTICFHVLMAVRQAHVRETRSANSVSGSHICLQHVLHAIVTLCNQSHLGLLLAELGSLKLCLSTGPSFAAHGRTL